MLDTSKSATNPVMTRCGGDAVFLPFWAIFCVLKMKSCINISEKYMVSFIKTQSIKDIITYFDEFYNAKICNILL
jgi:F0F1-type ATP synthase assembly protein I